MVEGDGGLCDHETVRSCDKETGRGGVSKQRAKSMEPGVGWVERFFVRWVSLSL